MQELQDQIKDWERIKRLCNRATSPNRTIRKQVVPKLEREVRQYFQAYAQRFDYSNKPRDNSLF